MSDEIKFPLSKKLKDQYSDDYEKIFLKRPVHNMKDEKLVELVNANRDKITPNAKATEQPSQEGIKDEEIKASETGPINNGSGEPNPADGIEPIGEGQLNEGEQAAIDKAQKERDFQFYHYKELHGEDADEALSTEEVTAANVSKLNYNTAVKVYFDLFAKRPIEEMTTDQILSAIANEETRQAAAKAEAAKTTSPAADTIDYNPETEMLIFKKTDKTKEKIVINKNTFPFLKEDYEAVSEIPKELLNKK